MSPFHVDLADVAVAATFYRLADLDVARAQDYPHNVLVVLAMRELPRGGSAEDIYEVLINWSSVSSTVISSRQVVLNASTDILPGVPQVLQNDETRQMHCVYAVQTH